MSESSVDLVTEVLEAWNERDLDRLMGLFLPNAEWYDLGMVHPPARGRNAIRAFMVSLLAAFPDFRFKIIPPICVSPDGSRCAVHWSITATHTGVLTPPGLSPTNRRVDFIGVDLIDIKDGRIARIFTAFDLVAAAGQLLGVSLRPPAGSIRERLLVSVQRLVAFIVRNLFSPKKKFGA